ncbi:aconitate hydratase AcnA [Loktanella sp. F6476L]|uniref:aconitate hydratase AcnA n=1 Tax=Loktanella sp. F6476L TaxID=2926405 RepID=UPI001FF64E35|nr:aconitate hydratase AcnA [Loktanella sp. F6476L]MCK0118928.1 aconitate hydratase AcnA [Loktanella sp. F6476L]
MKNVSVDAGETGLRVIDLPAILGEALARLPMVLRLLCENHVRNGGAVEPMLEAMRNPSNRGFEFSFLPNRLLMHDTTCTPALADIAAMRDAVAATGGDPAILSPTLPVDVSVDHSLAVDQYASAGAFQTNAKNEYTRNAERYAFMKWASESMERVRVHPPGTGIMHTINLEQLATVLEVGKDGFAHPDMLLGTDSHTPMINGIGVMAWGVGGLEAESVMFGQPVSLAVPKTVGVRLIGCLPAGSFATDLALEVTHRLREIGVTGEFVEFFGPGVATLGADARAVVANMAPEYGASTGYFPVDKTTIDYLARTGRSAAHCKLIEPAFRAMGLWFDPDAAPDFDRVIEIDLSTIAPIIAGPRRPQDRCAPRNAQARIENAIGRPLGHIGRDESCPPDGAVAIAAITSCTNTSDPSLLVAAGILARNARERGLTSAPWVKTSLAPGSPSARALLQRAGLADDLSALGFDVVGFGCTTCIGNSGPLPDTIELALTDGKAVAAVLSGNRNFPGRLHPKIDLGFLASPPLVVAYAVKGDLKGDLARDPLGIGTDGEDVFLADIWPDAEDIAVALANAQSADDVPRAFADASQSAAWNKIDAPRQSQFPWNAASRYLRPPKFASAVQQSRLGHYQAKPLMVLGDDITTDHISPAGAISANSAAGKWLVSHGAKRDDLNVYAAYRGNWEVMLRGLFTNKLGRNYLQDGLAPDDTVLEDGRVMRVFEAAETMAKRGQSAVLLAGERYGMGSSRDWAAKGVALLGVRAVIARSFERIHRTNLIGMGILPLQIADDFVPQSAGLSALDSMEIDAPIARIGVQQKVTVRRHKPNGSVQSILCRAAVETRHEVELLRVGGVLSGILTSCLS